MRFLILWTLLLFTCFPAQACWFCVPEPESLDRFRGESFDSELISEGDHIETLAGFTNQREADLMLEVHELKQDLDFANRTIHTLYKRIVRLEEELGR